MENKLTTRIFLYFAAALMLFSVIVGSIFLLIYTENTMRNYRLNYIRKTEAFARALSLYFEDEAPNYPRIKQEDLGLGLYLSFMDDIALSNLWLVDRNTQTIHVEFGKYSITYSSIPDDVRTLIDNSMEGETAINERWADSLFQKNFVIAAPVRASDGTVLASVVVHARSKTMHDNIATAWFVLFGSLLMAFFVSLIASWFFSRTIVHPLKKMAGTTSKMTEGNYAVRTGIKQNNEMGMLANNIDVLASRLEISSQESQQLEQLRKNYISNISHELRTPVAVIRSSLEALCDKVVTKESMVDFYHQEMLSESIHLQRMVNDLLELSRLQNPDYSMEKQGVDFLSIVEDAVRTCGHIAGKTDHTIQFQKNAAAFPFCGDYGRLRQMLVTVLDNAIKFSTAGEPIRVTVQVDKDRCLTSISNVGMGILEQDISHVFEEYYMQVGESNRTGTGLGLSIAKRIADRHEINIHVSSVPGGETSFSFELFNRF